MANITFRLPDDIEDPENRAWLESAIEAGKPGPEFQAIRAHVPGVMRSFTKTREWIYHDGVLDFEFKELLRAYIALSGSCTYCSNQGVAREIRGSQDQLDQLLNYQQSDNYSAREKLAMRYADADEAMWEELEAEFSEPELVELGYWVGFTFGGQRWLRTLGSSQGQLQEAIDAAGTKVTVAGPSSTSD